MPQATDERVALVRSWKGLNVRETPNAIGEQELTDVLNLDLTDGGELVKRTGFKTVHGLNRVSDTFTRADNPVSLGSTETGTDTFAHVWTVSGPSTWGILAGQAFRNGPFGHEQAVVDLGGSNHEVYADCFPGADYMGLVTRYTDTNNMLLLQLEPTGIAVVYTKIAGAFVGYPTGVTWSSGDRFGFRVIDSTWTVFKNGVQVFQTVNALIPTGNKAGLSLANFGAGSRFDNVTATGFNSNSLVLGANSIKLIGFFNTASFQQFIARSGNNLYTSPDGVTWTIIAGGPWGNVEFGVQYTDKFYMVRRDDVIVQWDGTTASAIAGSPTGSFCRVFKDRLFVLNSYGIGATASRIYFSNPFDFSSTGWPATNYVGVGEGNGDVLVAIFNVQDYLIVFKSGAMWILYVQGSDTLAWILRPFNSEVGCTSKYTLVLYEGALYFLSVRGVYKTDGNTVQNLSAPVSPIFDSIVVSSASINQSSAFVWKDKYVLVLETFPVAPTWNSWSTLTWNQLATTPWSGSGATYTYLVYHIRQKGWTKWKPATGYAPHIFVSVILNSAIKGVYSGDRALTGKVYRYGDAIYQDDVLNYEAAAEIKEHDFGSPTEMKRGKWLGVDMRSVGQYVITHVVDGIGANVVGATATGSQQEQRLPGPGYFRSWRTRFSATHPNPVALYGYALHMAHRRQIEKTR